MSSISETFSRMTNDEVWYAAANPLNAYYINAARTKAYERSRALFQAWTLEDGIGDAFRHAFASAMLARDIGVQEAYAVTDMHEAIPNNPYDKKTMDLYNNHQGVLVYLEAQKHLDDSGLSIMAPSDDVLEDRVLRAAQRGQLKVINTNP